MWPLAKTQSWSRDCQKPHPTCAPGLNEEASDRLDSAPLAVKCFVTREGREGVTGAVLHHGTHAGLDRQPTIGFDRGV
eukprot:6629174-Pyramimonas_sp.AAC.1